MYFLHTDSRRGEYRKWLTDPNATVPRQTIHNKKKNVKNVTPMAMDPAEQPNQDNCHESHDQHHSNVITIILIVSYLR